MQLPEELLKPLPKLEELLFGGKADERGTIIVQGNLLRLLPEKLFLYAKQLKILDLSDNKLQKLPAHRFQGLQFPSDFRLADQPHFTDFRGNIYSSQVPGDLGPGIQPNCTDFNGSLCRTHVPEVSKPGIEPNFTDYRAIICRTHVLGDLGSGSEQHFAAL